VCFLMRSSVPVRPILSLYAMPLLRQKTSPAPVEPSPSTRSATPASRWSFCLLRMARRPSPIPSSRSKSRPHMLAALTHHADLYSADHQRPVDRRGLRLDRARLHDGL